MDQKDDDMNRVSRRTFLKGAGGATLVLVTGGGVWRAREQGVFSIGEGPAYQPWENWHRAEGVLALVSAAILAANAHNTQPWLFRVGESCIDLFADTSRHIGAVDPFLREMYISLGCALENLLLAARVNGYAYRLTLMPDRANPAHAATVDLAPGSQSDDERPGGEASPLYEAIPNRHTNRHAYDTSRALPLGVLDALEALGDGESRVKVFWFATEAQRYKVADLLVAAAKAINADNEQSRDNLLAWLRIDQDAIRRHRDGLTLNTMGISTVAVVAAKMLPKPSLRSAEEAWLEGETRQTQTAGAFGILAIRDYQDDAQRMRLGKLWQRMHLWMIKEGLAAQPMNQLHERADREEQLGIEPRFGDALQDLIGDTSWRAAFTFRLGYPTEQAPASPRRMYKAVLV